MVNLACVPKVREKRKEYVKPEVALRKITYWTKVGDQVSILLGNLKISRLTPLLAERDSKVAPEMCIVGPIYCQLCGKGIKTWTPCHLDKIREIGYELHTKTRIFFKLQSAEANRIRPNAIYPQFLVGTNKIEILMGNPCNTGDSIKNIEIDTIQHLLESNDSIVLTTANRRCISFWCTKSHTYMCYVPPQGFGKNLEYSFILKSKNLKNLYHYLDLNIGLTGRYEIFCVRILSKEPVVLSLKSIIKERADRIVNRVQDLDVLVANDYDLVLEENETHVVKQGEPIEMEEIDRSTDSYKIPFSKDFANHYYGDRGFLSASVGRYIREPEKIIIANIAAAMYLHHIRASLWTHQTVDDILLMADSLYEESVNSGIINDIYWIQRIPQPITFGAKKYKILFEKIVIGDITTEENFVFAVKQGIAAFFKHSDLGIIYSPQPQLIFQEGGLYWTFSPKERDPVGRKWTRILTSRLAGNANITDLPPQGSACISWFKDLPCLAEAYLANIILKHRKDQYRIVKMKIIEIEDVSEDVKNWKSYAPNKWRIVGDKTICHYIQNSETGVNLLFPKAFTIACAHSLYAKMYSSDDWESANIDEILKYGNDYYKESVSEKPDLLTEFNYKNLKRTFVLGGKRYQIVIGANKYQGWVFYNKGNSPDLAKALKLYFDDYQFGLILISDKFIIPIFQMNGYYHLLFVYDKVFGKTELCLCSSENIYGQVYGHAFAGRFKDIKTMHEEILTIMSMADDEKYELYIVEGKDRPPLLNYTQFGENAAILHPNDGLHEGSNMFNVRADKQTYANILVTLCYVNMSRPLEWSPEDVADLLRTGDSIYCKLTVNLKDCSELFYKMKLEDVTPHIGWNKFSYTAEVISGIFKLYPSAEEEEEMEVMEEDEEEGGGGGGGGGGARGGRGGGGDEEMAVVNQLETILGDWEAQEQVLAILDSRVIKLGLWKKDLVYFVFDPKASLPDGKLTPRRIQRAATSIEFGDNDITDLRHIENEGTAYVAYFYDLESFIQHLLSCLPREYHSENFTIHLLKVTCPPVPTNEFELKYQPNTSYVVVQPNIFIIRGTISQDETMFQNPNKQEIANCIVSIGFAYITAQNKWNSQLVNIVLKYGDRLHIKSLDRLEKTDFERYCDVTNRPLGIDDIVKSINIYKVRFKFTVTGKQSNCINPGGEQSKDIKKLFSKLQNVENGSGAIIRIKDRTNAIWKQGAVFFLFDPFKCDPSGYCSTNGSACLMKFSKFELFMEYLIKKYICKNGPNNFDLYMITCERSMPLSIPGFYMSKYNFAMQRPTNQIIFEEIDNGMRMLKRQSEIGSKSVKFICLAALLYSRVEYVELWNNSIMDKIVLLADFLQRQLDCKTNTLQNTHLEDVNFSVKIDSILCNIVVNHVVEVTPLTEVESKNLNMRQGLQGFFLEHNNCIITSDRKCYAIWNEGPKYYMFWYRESDKHLVLLVGPNWTNFYNIILDDCEESSPTYFIKKAIITRIKMWDLCKEGEKDLPQRPDDFDEKCRECNFSKFIEDYMTRNNIRAKMNSNFKEYSQGIEILCGDLIKSNEFFCNDALFCECAKACCLTAAAMSLIAHPESWTKETLKQIVLLGTDLYKSNIAVARKTCFDMTDFQNEMNFMNYNMCVSAQPPTIEDFNVSCLLNPLAYILRKCKIAYLGVDKQFYMTIFMYEHHTYMFYAGSPSPYITDVDRESTCLIRADSLIGLVEFIVKYRQTTDPAFVGGINAKFL